MVKYRVKKGDTLSEIAQRYGVSVSDISGYRSGNPDLIYPDEILDIGVKANKDYFDSVRNAPVKIENGNIDEYDVSYEVPDDVYDLGSDLKSIQDEVNSLLVEQKNLDKYYANQARELESIDLTDLNEKLQKLKMLKSDRDIIKTRLEQESEGRGIVTNALRPYTASELRKNALATYALAQDITALTNKKELEQEMIKRKYDVLTKPILLKIDRIKNNLDYLDKRYKKRKDLLAQVIKERLADKRAQLERDKLRIQQEYKKELEKLKARNRLNLEAYKVKNRPAKSDTKKSKYNDDAMI